MKKKIKNRFHAIDISVLVFLSVYAISLLLLVSWGFLTSLKSYDDFKLGNKLGLPNLDVPGAREALSFGNYKDILLVFRLNSKDASYTSALFGEIQNAPDVVFTFKNFLFNSFVYSIVCSLVHAFVAFSCAYLCAKYKFRFSGFMYAVMLVVMAIPIVGSSPSMIVLLRDLGIYDSMFSMILLNLNFTGMYFFVFHAYLSGLSDTYVEAAEIDGASQMGIFIKIIFPLCVKIFFTVFLLQFIQTWNDYQTPLLYYPNHPTLAYAIFEMRGSTDGIFREAKYQAVPFKITGCMVLAIPVFVLFVAFNKFLMGNLTMGGLKE